LYGRPFDRAILAQQNTRGGDRKNPRRWRQDRTLLPLESAYRKLQIPNKNSLRGLAAIG